MIGALAEVRSGSLHDRSMDDALYVLASDISLSGLRTSSLALGSLPAKSFTAAALSRGDVLVSLRGFSNPAAVVPCLEGLDRPLFATLDVAVIKPSAALASDYLAWFLNRPSTQDLFAGDRSGSTAPRLPLSALKKLDVPLPPVDRQLIIASAAAEGAREAAILSALSLARQSLFHKLLGQAADEGSVRGDSPARTDRDLHGRSAALQAVSSPEEWNPQNAE